MITDWLAFWDGPHSIYISARHKNVHYRLIAKEIAALVAGPQARVLDYGCGEALHADLIAEVAGEVFLCEAAPSVRDGLQKRFAENPKIRVIEPHEIARLPEHSLDLLVMHSVAHIDAGDPLLERCSGKARRDEPQRAAVQHGQGFAVECEGDQRFRRKRLVDRQAARNRRP